MSRFVRPETARLELSKGDWLIVKKRLNAGETRDLFTSSAKVDADGRPQIDTPAAALAIVVAYLLDWSLTDDDNMKVEIQGVPADQVRRILDNLTFQSFNEITEAVALHDAAQRADEQAEKKTHSDDNASATTSPSLVAVAGATSG